MRPARRGDRVPQKPAAITSRDSDRKERQTSKRQVAARKHTQPQPVRGESQGCGGESGVRSPQGEDGRRERGCLEGGRSGAAVPGARGPCHICHRCPHTAEGPGNSLGYENCRDSSQTGRVPGAWQSDDGDGAWSRRHLSSRFIAAPHGHLKAGFVKPGTRTSTPPLSQATSSHSVRAAWAVPEKGSGGPWMWPGQALTMTHKPMCRDHFGGCHTHTL